MNKIGIFYGGRSTEHDASLKSKETICEMATDFEIVDLVFVDRNGEIFLNEKKITLGELIDHLKENKDVFYLNFLHGQEGEDGSWCGLFDIIDVVGSFESVNTSSILMNKYQQSMVAGQTINNLNIPKSALIYKTDDKSQIILKLNSINSDFVIVKPNSMGASHFTDKFATKDSDQIVDFVKKILEYDDFAIIQEYIDGEEYTCGVIMIDGKIKTLPIIHVKSSIEGFLGHTSKHTKASSNIDFNDFKESSQISEITEKLWNLFGIKGMCRFDFLISPNGSIYFLEGNLLPGFSGGSAFPRMLKMAGVSINDFIKNLIQNFQQNKVRNKFLPYSIED